RGQGDHRQQSRRQGGQLFHLAERARSGPRSTNQNSFAAMPRRRRPGTCQNSPNLHDARVKTHFLFRAACTVALTVLSAGELFARTRYSSSSSSSSAGTVLLLVVGVVALVVGVTVYLFYADKKRAEKIQAVA